MVYGTIVEVILQKLSQWYCDASPEAPSPEYTGSGDYRSSASGGSAQEPSSHLTVADHRGPDAVSPQKCTRSPLKPGDLERFRLESALGPLQKWETQSSFMAKVSALSLGSLATLRMTVCIFGLG